MSKKLQPIQKRPFQIIDKPTDVTYKLIDSNKNENVQHRNNLLPYYPKELALRELTQLNSFAGLKIVHDNSDKNQKQTNDSNCYPQLLEPKKKGNTRQKFQEISKKQIPQKTKKPKNRRKNFTTRNKREISTTTNHRDLEINYEKITKLLFHRL